MSIVTTSADSTRSIAAAIGAVLERGDVVVLAGEMGAGKTTFAQGLARGLGVDDRVTSPSFTIVQEYDGAVPVAHVDVYRLERIQDLHELGFEELVDSGRVVIVEWGDMVERVLPRERLVVTLGLGVSDDERTIEIAAHGARWRRRQSDVTAAAAAAAAATRAAEPG